MRNVLRYPAVALVAALVVAACTPGAPAPPTGTAPAVTPPAGTAPAGTAPADTPTGEDWQGVDDGTTLTMWTRAATEERVTDLVNAYNESHQNQIELRVVPTDDYVAVVGAAAPNNQLPDLFSADVVFMPNWTSAGLFTDITERIDGLPYIDNVGQAHIVASTWEGRKYGLPFIIDLSVWAYNKALFRDAGLDPESPPTNLAEFAEAARAVQALDRDGVYGTFFGGNCGGCNVFTWWPISWADGEAIMNEEGTESLLTNPSMMEVYSTFNALWEEGVIHPDSQAEAGPTWTGYFPAGGIGIMPMPASLSAMVGENLPDEDVGVTAIAGVDGGQSTFVGGDSIGISKDSQNLEQAWNFLAWMLDEEAQVEVVAQAGNVVARSDLADNEYSSADERLVLFNEVAAVGETPFALHFFATFNDPLGPWIPLFRAAVFEGADEARINELNEAINSSLRGE